MGCLLCKKTEELKISSYPYTPDFTEYEVIKEAFFIWGKLELRRTDYRTFGDKYYSHPPQYAYEVVFIESNGDEWMDVLVLNLTQARNHFINIVESYADKQLHLTKKQLKNISNKGKLIKK